MSTPSTSQPLDRRVRRSRDAIRKAFVALVLDQGYEAISVEDIIRSADVARATFYAHYSDKHDVLVAIVQDLATELTERIRPLAPIGPVLRGALIKQLFAHVDERRELYRVVLSDAPSGRARSAHMKIIAAMTTQVFSAAIAANGGTPRMPVEVIALAWTGTYTALVEWWLTESPDCSVDELTVMALQLLIRGFPWAGGLPADALSFDDSDLVVAQRT